jgi:hypothetical protein
MKEIANRLHLGYDKMPSTPKIFTNRCNLAPGRNISRFPVFYLDIKEHYIGSFHSKKGQPFQFENQHLPTGNVGFFLSDR